MKHVCVMTSVHPPFDVRIFHKECKAFVRSGYAVTLIAPTHEDVTVDGVNIKAIRQSRRRLTRVLGATQRVYREAIRVKADIYHFHDPELIPVGLLLRICGRTVVYDVHEDVPAQILSKHWIPKPLRRLLSILSRLVERLVARHFSAIVAANEDIAEHFRNLNQRTIIVHNYPMLQEFPQPPVHISRSESPQLIANFGGISILRAAPVLIDALALLPANISARMALAGTAESEVLHQQLRRRPGWDRVDYHGQIDRPQMLQLLAVASVAIVVYSPAPNHLSVRSNRLFEALAAGVPVIVSNFPQWQDFVEHGGSNRSNVDRSSH